MTDGQSQGTGERIEEGDDETYNIFGYIATANEVHAAQLGLVGVFAGLAYGAGMTTEALGASALLIGLAFGTRKLPNESPADSDVTIAIETKRHEPWWFTTPYIVTFIIGILLNSLL
jgi:hypothetical protein